MTTTTLAVGDLFTAIPSLWESAKVPASIVILAVGVVAGAFQLTRGFGAAAGRVIGAIALGAIALGGSGLMMSLKGTVDKHGGNITTGTWGSAPAPAGIEDQRDDGHAFPRRLPVGAASAAWSTDVAAGIVRLQYPAESVDVTVISLSPGSVV